MSVDTFCSLSVGWLRDNGMEWCSRTFLEFLHLFFKINNRFLTSLFYQFKHDHANNSGKTVQIFCSDQLYEIHLAAKHYILNVSSSSVSDRNTSTESLFDACTCRRGRSAIWCCETSGTSPERRLSRSMTARHAPTNRVPPQRRRRPENRYFQCRPGAHRH